jgi:hypothetical protein
MAQERPAAPRKSRPVSYRALGLFWAGVLLFVGLSAVSLQVLGPVPPPAPPAPPPPAVAPPPPPVPTPTPVVGAGIPEPDKELLEEITDNPGHFQPTIAKDEHREPSQFYASHAYDKSARPPFVAMVVSGAGLDQEETERLLNDLPGAIDVAFSAYMPGRDDDEDQRRAEENYRKGHAGAASPLPVRADALTARARATSHECLLSIPMEPSGYPTTNEGPKALVTSANEDAIKQNLEWALSRLGGCIGATSASDGLNGDRFAQTSPFFKYVVEQVTDRGLLYLDPQTGAPDLFVDNPGSIRLVDTIVDLPPNPDKPEEPASAARIDQRLDDLVTKAKLQGSAVGLAGPPTPLLLERLRVWVSALPSRGVTLVPLTAIPPPQPPPGAADPNADAQKASDTDKAQDQQKE